MSKLDSMLRLGQLIAWDEAFALAHGRSPEQARGAELVLADGEPFRYEVRTRDGLAIPVSWAQFVERMSS